MAGPPAAEIRRGRPTLRVAPLEVGACWPSRLFGRQTVALTSATLSLGGSFEPLARQWGLPAGAGRMPGTSAGRAEPTRRRRPEPSGPSTGRVGRRPGAATRAEPHSLAWTGLDVGSPFDHPRSGILYVARHLPPPGRDGLPESYLDRAARADHRGRRPDPGAVLVHAGRQAGGRRAARGGIGQFPLLCQGEDSTSQLVSQFAADEPTCLFGTISLWQGVDVPGRSLQLVVIDRIPFPRPDDPLASARQRAVAARGGNGFMTVAAAQAALLLAQGAGRLLRTMTDKGVVASWIPGWPPPAMAASCARRCRRSGPPPTPRSSAARSAAWPAAPQPATCPDLACLSPLACRASVTPDSRQTSGDGSASMEV